MIIAVLITTSVCLDEVKSIIEYYMQFAAVMRRPMQYKDIIMDTNQNKNPLRASQHQQHTQTLCLSVVYIC